MGRLGWGMEVSGGVWSATPQRRGGAVGSGSGAREAGRAAGSNLLITPSLF